MTRAVGTDGNLALPGGAPFLPKKWGPARASHRSRPFQRRRKKNLHPKRNLRAI